MAQPGAKARAGVKVLLLIELHRPAENKLYTWLQFEEIYMDRRFQNTQRRQVISELRHQLRYAQPTERHQIRQELDFWQRQAK
jgi:hypothetical protein